MLSLLFLGNLHKNIYIFIMAHFFVLFFFSSIFFFFQYHLGDDLEFHFLKVLERALKEAKPSNCGKLSSVFLMQLQKLLERNKEVHFMMVSDSVSFALF